jgi:uncharacterized protein YciU (UPF0263 family)
MPRLTPIEIVHLAASMPHAQTAAHLASSDWDEAVGVVTHKDVVAYVGMCIIDEYGQSVADDFMEDVGAVVEEDTPEPIIKFRKLMHDDIRKDKRMKRHQVMGNLIKVFNAWEQEIDLPKRWTMTVDEDFPQIVTQDSEPLVEAAE